MRIKNFDSEQKRATVHLNFDDINCIMDCLQKVHSYSDVEKHDKFNEVIKNFSVLYSVTMFGTMSDWSINQCYKLINEGKETQKSE